MKLTTYLLTGAMVLGLTACATTPQENAAAKPATSTPPTAASAQSKGPSSSELEAQQLKEAMAKMAGKSVFFDYDDFAVTSKYQDVVQQQAELLKKLGKVSVTLEGSADERGSAEYNLALGQKRADAVRKALVLIGVPDSRIEAVSFGEEKPKATCPEEKCWSQNRRVDFVPKAQ